MVVVRSRTHLSEQTLRPPGVERTRRRWGGVSGVDTPASLARPVLCLRFVVDGMVRLGRDINHFGNLRHKEREEDEGHKRGAGKGVPSACQRNSNKVSPEGTGGSIAHV